MAKDKNRLQQENKAGKKQKPQGNQQQQEQKNVQQDRPTR